jgi:hypothetical protein
MEPIGESPMELHLVPQTFENNAIACTFICFAGSCSPAQRRSFYLVEGLEGHLGGRGPSELPQDEVVLPVDTCRFIVGMHKRN